MSFPELGEEEMRRQEIVRRHAAHRVPHIASTTTGQKFTVFIVDDDAGVLKALARLIRAACYKVRTFSSALEYLENREADIPGCLVLDVRMPHLDGRQLQAALLREGDVRPIIFISGADDVPTAVAAIKAAAIDFLSKPITEQALLGAINIAVEQEAKSGQQRAQLAAINRKLARLSPREAEVLRYVIAGHCNKKISWHLGPTVKTIKVHRSRMMRKMEVRFVANLVQMTDLAGIEPYNDKNSKSPFSDGSVQPPQLVQRGPFTMLV
jgi:FixJ family two-component response regulator